MGSIFRGMFNNKLGNVTENVKFFGEERADDENSVFNT